MNDTPKSQTRFVAERDKNVVDAKAAALSFRELAKKHGLKQLSEEKYRVNVKVASRRRSKKT
jgi:hypothetical protein